MDITYSTFVLFLRKEGYWEAEEVLQSGDVVVRGDTVTWWPVNSVNPLRFHFFGEELEKAEILEEATWKMSTERPLLQANVVKTPHGEIKPSEYVVHPHHGVGIFEYVVTRKGIDGVKQYLSLKYAGNDTLLFPAERQEELMPYIGMRHPRLTRLYSQSWQRTKERVQKNLIQVARELLKIYATRQLTNRPAYPKEGQWQRLLAESAGFELTGDQARAVGEVEYDLAESTIPMDRLLCGDVGFGKTEVALRAAAYVLAAGKQVALIAPTTVLAEQHYTTISQRLAALPVTIDHLSRLTSGREKDVLERLQAGKVDVLVGTHRVLGKDVHFPDLGLLILDEEQKFGVAQKEYLKSVRPSIDVLSLSATPIPRTLSLSLSGLRGLSLLRTPPHGRLPVETIIHPFSQELLNQAVQQEVSRNGQVYVVHNRVQSLGIVRERVTQGLREQGLNPVMYEQPDKPEGVVVAMAHGQMGEVELAATMSAFIRGEIQVLVASSIVEHGLDSPLANTLIVLHSEWFGLSDLYQLRGRVGRRKTQAHAYFFTGGVERASVEEVKVTETARRRLHALQEADELGSGWSIAMRDLEIRGGGNILGHEQHGSMEAIGLLLYAQLLQEEIGRQARRQGITLFQNAKKVD